MTTKYKKLFEGIWGFSFWFAGLFALIFPLFLIYKVNWSKTILVLLICCVLFAAGMLIDNTNAVRRVRSIHPRAVLFLIWLFCFIPRLIVILFLNDHMIQISDFGSALERARDMEFGSDYYRVFSHWISYSLVNHGIFQLFGDNQIVAMVVNSILLSFIPVFLFLLGKKIWSGKAGAAAAVFYIIWPSTILYVTIFSPDHYAALLLTIAVYLVVLLMEKCKGESRELKKEAVTGIILGFVLSISTFFKNFASVFLLALFLVICVNGIKRRDFSAFLKTLGIYAVVLCSFSLMKTVAFYGVETQVGNTVGRNIAPCYLNVGLNSAGNGGYDAELYDEYFSTLEEENYDFEKTNTQIMDQLKKDICLNYRLLPDKLLYKAERNFSGDYDKMLWVKNSIAEKQVIKMISWITDYGFYMAEWYWLFIGVLVLCGIIWTVFEKNDAALYIVACVIGVAMELLLVESQERYRYAIEPMFCLLAGIGYFYGVQKVRRLCKSTLN